MSSAQVFVHAYHGLKCPQTSRLRAVLMRFSLLLCIQTALTRPIESPPASSAVPLYLQ